MFAAIRNVKFNAQIGPHETFAELQAAAAREIPGAVRDSAGRNAGQWIEVTGK